MPATDQLQYRPTYEDFTIDHVKDHADLLSSNLTCYPWMTGWELQHVEVLRSFLYDDTLTHKQRGQDFGLSSGQVSDAIRSSAWAILCCCKPEAVTLTPLRKSYRKFGLHTDAQVIIRRLDNPPGARLIRELKEYGLRRITYLIGVDDRAASEVRKKLIPAPRKPGRKPAAPPTTPRTDAKATMDQLFVDGMEALYENETYHVGTALRHILDGGDDKVAAYTRAIDCLHKEVNRIVRARS